MALSPVFQTIVCMCVYIHVLLTIMGFETGIVGTRASLAAQLGKNLPAMQETQVQFLSREDPLEEEKATHSSILAWKNLMDRGAWQAYSPCQTRV